MGIFREFVEFLEIGRAHANACRSALKVLGLEAFSVHNRWAGLIVFLLRDPHLLEGGQGSEDGSSDPDRVFTLWWGDDLDLHGWWGKSGDLLLHAVGDA